MLGAFHPTPRSLERHAAAVRTPLQYGTPPLCGTLPQCGTPPLRGMPTPQSTSHAGQRHATSVHHAAAVRQVVASKSGTSLPVRPHGGTIQPHGDAEHSDSGPQTTGRCNPLPHAWMAKARQRITPHPLPWQCSGLPLPAATTPPPWRTSNPTATKLAMVAPTLCSRLVAPVKYLSHPLSLTAG